MDNPVVNDMLQRGLMETVSGQNLDGFLAGDELRVLFFSGGDSRQREAHDVAVALRELLKDHGKQVRAALIDPTDEAALLGRFRVAVLPSLVLALGGEPLEVLPGVKDWGVYTAAFQRYLGAPQTITNLMENAS